MIEYSLEQISKIVDGTLIGAKDVTIKGVHFDSRLMEEGMMFAPIKGERVDGHSFVKDLLNTKASASFWQEDDILEKPAGNLIVVKDVTQALRLLALDYRKQLTCHFIGVTGSSGKTSTKDIVASVVSAKYKTYKTKGNQNNDLGVPITILNMPDDVEYAVCEIGIDNFGIMERLVEIVKPELTVITSIGPAHIAQLLTLDNIVQQKCLINKYLGNGQCFYNATSYGLKDHLATINLQNEAIGYGFDEGVMRASDYQLNDAGTSFVFENETYNLPVLGKHQVLNALAGIGIGRAINLTTQQIKEGLASVKLTPHRLQLRRIKEATIIDDTYNSNPSSLAASLQMLSEYNNHYQKIVILGDMLELGVNSKQLHASVAESVDFKAFDTIYLVGEQMAALKTTLNEKGIECTYFETIEPLKEVLKPYLLKNHVLFFKASNGMKFAGVIDSLEASI